MRRGCSVQVAALVGDAASDDRTVADLRHLAEGQRERPEGLIVIRQHDRKRQRVMNNAADVAGGTRETNGTCLNLVGPEDVELSGGIESDDAFYQSVRAFRPERRAGARDVQQPVVEAGRLRAAPL